jgi:hypothetical protein
MAKQTSIIRTELQIEFEKKYKKIQLKSSRLNVERLVFRKGKKREKEKTLRKKGQIEETARE